MAANHTEYSAITDGLAVDYLWDHLKKNGGVTKQQAIELTKTGLLSVSNLLEQIIADNNKQLKRSNEDGEDFNDHSDAKYMRARSINHSKRNGKNIQRTWCSLSSASVRNKKGALRIFITYMDENIDKIAYRMFVLPYPIWKKRMTKTGVSFSFSSKDGSLTESTAKRWGEFEVKTVKGLSA
jgi:hypothetical protein